MKLQIITLLSLLAFTLALPSSRIVGGENADPSEYRFVASLRNRFGFHFCSGIIINENWVLTTANCLDDVAISEITIAVNSTELSKGIHHKVSKVVENPGYSQSTRNNNLALLRTTNPIEIGENASQPAPLLRRHAGEENAIVAGWGRNGDGMIPDNLQFIKTQVLSREKCEEQVMYINENELCALGNPGQGACIGDQGGPLKLQDGGKVFALMAFTVSIQCGANYPDGYQSLVEYLDWIESVSQL